MRTQLPISIFQAAEILWTFNVLSEEPRQADVCIGLGSHDLAVATRCAELYLKGYVDRLIFTGANSPTTVERFPRGEAVHYAEEAIRRGVSPDRVLVETAARNTGDNFVLTRKLLEEQSITIRSALLVTRPYQERRALATARQLWPEVQFIPTPQEISFQSYLETVGADRLLSMLVGDTQRVIHYPRQGFATQQDVPPAVVTAMEFLIQAGYTSRLLR